MPPSKEIILSGTIIHGDEFELLEGYIAIRDGIIREIGRGPVDSDLEGIVCPCFVNAHSHVGDSVFKDPPFQSLADLVGPGGLKHRVLAQWPRHLLVEGMRRSLLEMAATGTCAFADFREGGMEGVEMLLEALQGVPLIPRIFGRPLPGSRQLHKGCWGLGISSTRDSPLSLVQEMAELARAEGRRVAIHAGESDPDDIADALRMEPDILVHLSRASEEELGRVAASGSSVVISPRSNLVTGVGLPNLRAMVELGIAVGVGTDNVMLNSTNMFGEMELISKALLHDDRQVFKMCTLNGATILGIDRRTGSICVGKEGRVMVIDS
jgi:cytosine/adenosine deaminase-related metal-dependent hydrolase